MNSPAASRRPRATYYFSILIVRVVVAPQASKYRSRRRAPIE